jgi:hypothetical protein
MVSNTKIQKKYNLTQLSKNIIIVSPPQFATQQSEKERK